MARPWPSILAIALALVAVSVYLPAPAARAGVVLAIVIAAFIWMAEGLGGMLTGGGTDPNSGPLLALVALAYWPLASSAVSAPVSPTGSRPPSHNRLKEPDMAGPSWLAWAFAGVVIISRLATA